MEPEDGQHDHDTPDQPNYLASRVIATRKPTEYDAAVELLTDLCVLAQRTDQADAFTLRLDALRRRHERKPSLIDRLDQADLPHAPAPDAPAVS